MRKIQAEINREEDREKENIDLKGEVIKFKNVLSRLKKKRMDETVKEIKNRKV